MKQNKQLTFSESLTVGPALSLGVLSFFFPSSFINSVRKWLIGDVSLLLYKYQFAGEDKQFVGKRIKQFIFSIK